MGLFTDNLVVFLLLTTERLERTPDLLVTSSHMNLSLPQLACEMLSVNTECSFAAIGHRYE
jgi:hypothetical protein